MTHIRSFFIALAFTLNLPLWAMAGDLVRGPYLQQSTSASVVVVWRTEGESTPVLRYGDAPDALNQQIRGDAILLRVSADVNAPDNIPRLYKEPADEIASREASHDPSTTPNTYQYEAQVTGLKPGAKYYYAAYDGNQLLAGGDENHYFVTHRSIGSATDIRIWVVGDSGTGEEEQAMVHDAMRAYVNRTERAVDHYIHVGDMAYGDGTDLEFQDNFFAPYQLTLRNTVCWPALGNHEGHTSRGISGFGPYFDAYVVPTRGEVGGAPSGTEAYYSFDIDEVHFICLDSHDLDRSPDAAMAQWLRADLEQTKAKWMIAFWHHPPYTMGSHNSDREQQLIEMRENFMPILESGGVDLTLTGHSHIYERSMLMDGAYATPTTAHGVILDDGDGRIGGDGAYRKSKGLQPHQGSVSIVAGHGGAGISREGTMPVMREIILEHGSVILDIKDDTLTGTMLNKQGQIRDIFSLVKQGRVSPKRVKNPWQPINDSSLLTEIRLTFAKESIGTIPKGWKVVSGDMSDVRVIDESGKLLQAKAGQKDLFALYMPWNIFAFEYGTKLRLSGSDNKGAGLIFGFEDLQNYGRIFFDPQAGMIRVSRFVNGKETILAERKATVRSGQWLESEIEVIGGIIEVQFQNALDNDEIEFVLQGLAEFPQSPVGFYIPAKSTAEFQFFSIENNGSAR
ncbi:MAG: metallophosphoesterase [Verrucomicrobia bacterium]|nr:metallophosphoesterase [Verrucomicrobiota bacterium]MDA1069492.1 metallophosphoesterase [Verrucomicrobiota bacterium]